MKAITLKQSASRHYLRGIEHSRIRRLARNLPTPFMILRTRFIRDNLQRLRRALPNVGIYYAVKANNHIAVLKTLADNNCHFDISSRRELAEVLRLGVSPNRTIHTNPIKSIPEFDGAVEMGERTFVADNIIEIEKFAAYGNRAGLLLRFKTSGGSAVVNLSYKFGADTCDIPTLLDRIKELGIPFRGFCFHVGSQCTDPAEYEAAIRQAGDYIRLAREKGMTPEILDIGGGFPVAYTETIPPIETYGAVIRQALDDHIPAGIRIICEPGRFLCGDAVTLCSSVIGKADRGGVKWYYIDDGLYGSFSGRLFDNCRYQVLTNRNTTWEKAVLAGPTCDSFDVIYEDCLMPPLDVGDILLFPAMGAYCSVSATDFNGLGQTRVIAVDW